MLAVVDDTPDVRQLVRALLERAGATVEAEAASVHEALRRLDPDACGVVILDHHLEGGVLGFDGAADIRRHVPGAKIVLFTALDLAREVAGNPNIDAYMRKDRVLELPRLVQRLSEELLLQQEQKQKAAPSVAAERLLARWLSTPSLLFGDLPPPVEASAVTDHLVEPCPDRSDALLRFVA